MSEKAAKKAPSKKTSAKKAAPKAKTEKAVTPEVTETPTAGPGAGRVPVPIVTVRHEREMQPREARGFSLGELASAGITFNLAKKGRVPVDIRRRSVLEGNVGSLKGWYVPPAKKTKAEAAEKPEKRAKKAAKPRKPRATAKK